MFNFRSGAAALVIITCALSGCRKPAAETKTTDQEPAATAAAAPTGSAAAQQAPEPVKAEPIKPVPEAIPTVVARVNGENVAKADFDRLLKQMEMQAGQPVPKERRDEVYRAVIDQLVTYTALEQEARNRGIKISDAE